MDDQGGPIIATSDGHVLIAGRSASTDGDVTGNHGETDIWLVKLDQQGNIVWQKNIGGSGSDVAYDIIETTDGGYLLSGYTTSTDGDLAGIPGNNGYWLVRMDPNGEIIWQRQYGGSGSDWAGAIKLTSDGGYIIAGTSTSNDGDVSGNNGDRDGWLVKVDDLGILEWQMNYGDTGANSLRDVEEVEDGYVLFV